MTNHWRDIRHADLILVNGANPAEAHPVGFRWLMRAKLDRGAKIVHADPRFTRTSAVADTHLRIRTGSDVAYFGGLINYVINSERWNTEPFFREYVTNYTNAATIITASRITQMCCRGVIGVLRSGRITSCTKMLPHECR